MKKIAFLNASFLAFAGLLFCSTLLLSACGDDKKQIETLTKETETIHDETMKDMADMNRVARELKQTMISATMTPEQSAVYTQVLDNMGKAENEMMEWMKNYKTTDEMPGSEAIKYLQDQKMQIEKNRASIKAALEAGLKLQGK